MNDKRRTFGQYDTPADVADLILAFCHRHPADRLLDPSCGSGAFLARAAQMQSWLAPDQPLPTTNPEQRDGKHDRHENVETIEEAQFGILGKIFNLIEVRREVGWGRDPTHVRPPKPMVLW